MLIFFQCFKIKEFNLSKSNGGADQTNEAVNLMVKYNSFLVFKN